jgi:hypothetical protein
VIRREKVAASEKVVSFFEYHTDIIEKGGREPCYGHKVYLAGGRSGLILDCRVVRVNPRDSSLFSELIRRQGGLYGLVPAQVAADGGFASVDNLRWAKEGGFLCWIWSKAIGCTAGFVTFVRGLKLRFRGSSAALDWRGAHGGGGRAFSSMSGVRWYRTTSIFWVG